MPSNSLKFQLSPTPPLSQEEIQTALGSEASLIRTAGITGETAAWVVIATLTTQALPSILQFLRDMIQRNKIKSIKYKDITIENPTDEQVTALNKIILAELVKNDAQAKW
jgi:hypothetical protein